MGIPRVGDARETIYVNPYSEEGKLTEVERLRPGDSVVPASLAGVSLFDYKRNVALAKQVEKFAANAKDETQGTAAVVRERVNLLAADSYRGILEAQYRLYIMGSSILSLLRDIYNEPSTSRPQKDGVERVILAIETATPEVRGLIARLKDHDVTIKEAAAGTLGSIPNATDVLILEAVGNPDWCARVLATWALGYIGGGLDPEIAFGVAHRLQTTLEDEDESVRLMGMWALSRVNASDNATKGFLYALLSVALRTHSARLPYIMGALTMRGPEGIEILNRGLTRQREENQQ